MLHINGHMASGISPTHTRLELIQAKLVFNLYIDALVPLHLSLLAHAGPMVRHLGLQGLNDQAVHAIGYQELNESMDPSAAAHAVREISENPDTAHAMWKQLDRTYLKPLFGGRSGGQPHLYELGDDADEAEGLQDEASPHHVLEMQGSGLGHMQSGLSSVEADVEAYQPPYASDPAFSPTHRGQARTGNGLPHDNAEDT